MGYEDTQSTKLSRTAPSNVDAEAAVLGAVLLDNGNWGRVVDILLETDFYDPIHAEIFELCRDLIQKGSVADGITVRDHFEKAGRLDDVGGNARLADLVDAAALGPEISDYAKIVHDLSMRRKLIDIGSEIVQTATAPGVEETGASQIQTAEKKLFDLAERGSVSGGFFPFKNALFQSIEMATAAYERDGDIAGISTGLHDLDKTLGGLHRSDLVILAARPSMGKTSLATNIAFNAAHACRREEDPGGGFKTLEGAVVGFFSLEMSREQLATRVLAERSGIQSHRIRQGDLQPDEYARLRDAAAVMEDLPLHIDDTGGISISQIAARARRQQRTSGLDLLIIDYLQLITAGAGRKSDNRVQEVSMITQGLKALAKDLNIPIIALSQLSRQVEQRDDKRPQLADLRESGSIEQDADVVLFIYREEYYLSRAEPDNTGEAFVEWQQKMDRAANKAEVIISKQRHGPIGKVELGFDANVTRFRDLERHHSDREY